MKKQIGFCAILSILLGACGESASDDVVNFESSNLGVSASTVALGNRDGGLATDFKCSDGVCICSIGSDCSRDLPNSGKCTGKIVCGDFECACSSTK